MNCYRRHNNRSCDLLVFFVLASILAFVFTIYFNMHVHVLPDGRVVAHSHAFPKTNPAGNSHQHTNLELVVLDHFSGFKTLLIGVIISFIAGLFSPSLFSIYTPLFTKVDYALFSRRGPPNTL